ncbi:FAD-dependent oxidoreductase [Myxococcus xanthus]|uniref:FAD-dependent oxidoreductase n=1 Tax=Myxococcus xanthus TaxID=34 RepID=A0AAE6G3L5_MYXXA|nr:FAD-dependent oxidoreductase [Myxococcus xanthus]QDE70378.1 FAD-dependent oxidoreductase [Myxococcus xanthus]QDE77657.1 FAD-dependent oxidoreductase [Myxococcus xanthus]QDF06892.1 FAD-dependent oxidoreductase [Myxococcus xanthus]
MDTYDIVVAGNGALGLATARALTLVDPRLRIAVVGPVSRPAGASPAAGAMLGCYGEVTAPLLRTAPGRAKHAKGVLAARLWPSWLEQLNGELPEDAHVQVRAGTIVFSNAKSGTIEDENFIAIQQAVKDEEEPHELLDPNQVPGLNPAEDCRPKQALFLPREGSVDASRLLRALTLSLEQSPQVSVVDGAVKTLDVQGGRVTGVRLEDGRALSAAQVVLAMGVGTQAVLDELPELARRIPRIFSGGGTSLLLQVPRPSLQHVVRTPNRAFACGLHGMPRGGDQLYFGATNILMARPMLRTTPADMYFLLECVLEQIDQDLCAAQLVAWQAGNRPVTVDTCPLIGPTSVDGLWLLTGTYRDGLFLSPLLGQHMARRMCGQSGLVAEDFLPERKPISLYTLKEARAEALKHYLAMGWEHGIRLPKVGWHRAFPRFYQQMLDSLYDALGEEEFVMPPELLAIVDSNRAAMVPFFRNYYAEVRKAWA